MNLATQNITHIYFYYKCAINIFYLLSAHFIEDKDEYYNTLTEYLLFTVKGQVYIQDMKFDKLPFNEYNITVRKKEQYVYFIYPTNAISIFFT